MRPFSKHPLSTCTVAALLGLATHAASAAPSYLVTDLGTIGGAVSAATTLNEAGTVAGYSYNGASLSRAVVWQNGAARDLGTLGGTNSTAQAINDGGLIVGTSNLKDDRLSRGALAM